MRNISILHQQCNHINDTYPDEFGFVEVDILGGPGCVGQVAIDIVHVIRIVSTAQKKCKKKGRNELKEDSLTSDILAGVLTCVLR